MAKGNSKRIGLITNFSERPVEATQLKRLELEEMDKVLYKWEHVSKEGLLRNGDTLFIYDLPILGRTRKIMIQRIQWLIGKGVNIQLTSGRVEKLLPLEHQKSAHLAHIRAIGFYTRNQTKKASNTPRKQTLKIPQPLSDRILRSFYRKQIGELSHETVQDTYRRLKTDLGSYYKYLDRFLLAIVNREVDMPEEYPEAVFEKILRIRDIKEVKGKFVKLK